MEQQEYLMKLSMIQQESENLENKLQMIAEQIGEMQAIKKSIQELGKIKDNKDKEILANLGKGIFLKTVIKDKDLFLNIGKGVIVKKNPSETIKILDEQTIKLEQGRQEVIKRITLIQQETNRLVQQAQIEKESQEKEGKDKDSKKKKK